MLRCRASYIKTPDPPPQYIKEPEQYIEEPEPELHVPLMIFIIGSVVLALIDPLE
jgi:hypothetical protein